MLNQVVLVGRLTDNPEVATRDKGKKVTTIILAVQRPYKNQDGIYEADFIRCILWDAIATNTCEYCHKGDIVGIKGHIQISTYEVDGTRKYNTDVIAEKVTFLQTKKED
ncbi:MAG: single-stranded DNA-binding protein [Bacilli bacterium]|nr:single-stranded DNA-binding protein [Bacilli bacterium]